MLSYIFVFYLTAFTLSIKHPSSLMLLHKERIEQKIKSRRKTKKRLSQLIQQSHFIYEQGAGSDFYLNAKSLFLKLNRPAHAESAAALGADKNYGSGAAVVLKIKRNMKAVLVITGRTAGNFPL
jgi:hypothetical protein